jgi:cytochrome b
MEPITWVFLAAAALVTFAIAAGVVGREAHRLDAVAPRSVYVVDEAVEFVAEYLPTDSQARLTPAELEQWLAG